MVLAGNYVFKTVLKISVKSHQLGIVLNGQCGQVGVGGEVAFGACGACAQPSSIPLLNASLWPGRDNAGYGKVLQQRWPPATSQQLHA